MVLFILVLYIYCSMHNSNRTYFRYSTMSRRFRLSSSERIDIVKWYAVYQNAAEIARQFQHHYGRAPPTRESILDITRKFDETGSVQDLSIGWRKRIRLFLLLSFLLYRTFNQNTFLYQKIALEILHKMIYFYLTKIISSIFLDQTQSYSKIKYRM